MGTEEPLSLREDLKQLHQIETTSWDELSWSTARQRQYCSPLISTKASFMSKLPLYFRYYRLRHPAYLPPHHRHHSVTCSPLTIEPLSARVSSMNAAAHRLRLKQ
jgi:hypothetical protein